MVKKSGEATIAEMVIKDARVVLVGDSPLIVHAWSSKAKQEILDKQMKKAKLAKQPKNPEELFEEALYRDENGNYAFPAVAFKSAAVDACSMVSDMTKVGTRGAFHIHGSMVKLEYEEVKRREDMVRIGMGTADVRIRPEFIGWSVTLNIRFNSGVISIDQLATLFNVGGFSIGVGEWRPQKDGSNGMFHVKTAEVIQ